MTWIVEVRTLDPGLSDASWSPWLRLAAPGGQLIARATQEEAEGMAREWQATARQVRALLGEHLWLWEARAAEEGTS